MVMWDEIAVEVAKEFPDVTWDKAIVDAMTMRMTLKPESIDTVVATNPPRRHPLRSRRRARRLAGHRPDRQPQSRARIPLDVRADPRLRLRHHGQGHRQPHRHLLVIGHDARPCRGAGAAARLMRAIERVTADASLHTPDLGGQGDDAQGHRCGDRRHPRRQRIAGRHAGLWPGGRSPSMPPQRLERSLVASWRACPGHPRLDHDGARQSRGCPAQGRA